VEDIACMKEQHKTCIPVPENFRATFVYLTAQDWHGQFSDKRGRSRDALIEAIAKVHFILKMASTIS